MRNLVLTALLAARVVSSATPSRRDPSASTVPQFLASETSASISSRPVIFVTVTDYTVVTPAPRSTSTIYVTSIVTAVPAASEPTSKSALPSSPIWYSGSDIQLSTYSMSEGLPVGTPSKSTSEATRSPESRSTVAPTNSGFVWPGNSIGDASKTSSFSSHSTAPAAPGTPAAPATRSSPPKSVLTISATATATLNTTTYMTSSKSVSTSTTMPSSTLAHAPEQPKLTSSSPIVVVTPTRQSTTAVVVTPIHPHPTVTVHLRKRADGDNKDEAPKTQSSTAVVVVPIKPTSKPAGHSVSSTPTPERIIESEDCSSMPTKPSSSSSSQAKSTTAKSTSTLTTKPSPTTFTDKDAKTTVLSQDQRCPYPYPGIHCGAPKTTLVTESKTTKQAKTRTESGDESRNTGFVTSSTCPYPYPSGKGGKCAEAPSSSQDPRA